MLKLTAIVIKLRTAFGAAARAGMPALAIALAGAGCLRQTTYKCSSNDMCAGTGGTCETTGVCSFTDGTCNGGRRYGDLAGTYAGKCVGDVIEIDGGVTDATDSGMVDVPSQGCPSSYAALAGVTGHVYRVISATDTWDVQNAACAADVGTTYLAVPDSKVELDAIILASGQNLTWVGINDITTEDTYVTANGGTFAKNSGLWDFANSGEPDNSQSSGPASPNGADCVTADGNNNGNLADDRCDTKTYRAVCECEP